MGRWIKYGQWSATDGLQRDRLPNVVLKCKLRLCHDVFIGVLGYSTPDWSFKAAVCRRLHLSWFSRSSTTLLVAIRLQLIDNVDQSSDFLKLTVNWSDHTALKDPNILSYSVMFTKQRHWDGEVCWIRAKGQLIKHGSICNIVPSL